MFDWDFYPKWRVCFKNGLIIPENRLLWKELPVIAKAHNTTIEFIELDLGYGLIQKLPKAPAYYCSYKLGIDLLKKEHEELKIIGWGISPVQAKVYASDGTFFIQEISDPKEPFLLKI